MIAKTISLPLTDAAIADVKAGDSVLLSGILFTARDTAHKRIVEALDRGEHPPFDVRGATIYYMGPSPARPGTIIGSAGPTTSGRMDAYTPRLLAEGLKGMIGKGSRSDTVRQAMTKHRAIYFAAIGGIGALISKCVRASETIAYPELGAEAILRLEVENFPAVVINDAYGNDWYAMQKRKDT